jgi:acyl-CoA reductase-like NAD-dependent aldehyde dehydrogenase
MKEEIFGPVLVIHTKLNNTIPLRSVADCVRFQRSGDESLQTPLALYVFSSDSDNQKALMDGIQSGGTCINDTKMHAVRIQIDSMIRGCMR